MELYVMDIDFNRLGVIDNYREVEIEQHYTKHSKLHLYVDGMPHVAQLLISDDIRILVRSDDTSRGYIIDTLKYEDSATLRIEVMATSLSIMMNWRIPDVQQHYKGMIEDVIKQAVVANCISPHNAKRKMPRLITAVNQGIAIQADEIFTSKSLDILLWEICEKYDVSFEIILDHQTKQFVFTTYQGINRSTSQQNNSHVIFSKTFDNVVKQHYVNDSGNLKNTAYVMGDSNEVSKPIIVDDRLTGFWRREMYFDAKDVKAKYTEDGQEIIISQAEYIALLQARGQNRLVDYQHIRTFASEIDLYTQFRYRQHYFLGDKVSNRNDELGVMNDARVTSVYETFNQSGYMIKIDFGNAIPTLIDKLKREVK